MYKRVAFNAEKYVISFFTTSNLYQEVNCTEPSRSVSFPCLHFFSIFSSKSFLMFFISFLAAEYIPPFMPINLPLGEYCDKNGPSEGRGHQAAVSRYFECLHMLNPKRPQMRK